MDTLVLSNNWYVICEGKDVGKGPMALTRLGVQLVLWRDGLGELSCLEDRCPHRGAPLSAGRVVAGEIVCPYHGNRYDGRGTCAAIPSLGSGSTPACRRFHARSFKVVERHGLVWLWWGAARAEYPELPWFDDTEGHDFAGGSIEAKVHHTQILASFFDFHHASHAHWPYFAGVGALVHSQRLRRGEGELTFSATLAARAPEARRSWRDVDVTNTFRLPNLVRSAIGAFVVIVAAVTVVDEERSWIMTRVYVHGLPFAWLRRVAAQVVFWLDARIFQRQDLAILAALTPRKLRAKDFNPVPADAGSLALLRLVEQQSVADGNESGIL